MAPRTFILRGLAIYAVALGLGIVVGLKFRPGAVGSSTVSSDPATGSPTEMPPSAPAKSAVQPAFAHQPLTARFSSAATMTNLLEADPGPRGRDKQKAAFDALPLSEQESLWGAFSAARLEIRPLTEAQAAMPRNEGVRYFASNPSQQLTARFLDGAVRVESGRGGQWAGTLALAGGEKVEPVLVGGDRLEYRHSSGVTEWYVNKPEGIEHGFTLAARPESASGDELRLELQLTGLSARPVAGDQAVDFVDEANGSAVLRYDHLLVWDASGRELPARFEAQGGRLAILIADAGAAYPLTVDPIITSQEGKLLSSDGEDFQYFGNSVALSGDTALVGAYGDATPAGANVGSAYVFVRNGTVWTQQAKLVALDGLSNDVTVNDGFGNSVALSGDTALIGAYLDATASGFSAGSAYVFVRSGTTWWPQAKLVASDAASGDWFGFSLALSGDTALIGSYLKDTAAGVDSGSAYVFVRSGVVWTEQAKLVALDGASGDLFGGSVALSGDTVLVGAEGDSNYAGSAYVFMRPADFPVWIQQAKLVALDGAPGDQFGFSVALSDDTALIGARADATAAGVDAGSAYVFVRNGTAWSQQAKLVALDGAPGDEFGVSVALSGDTALIGSYLQDTAAGVDSGSAYVFVRSGVVWNQQAKLVALDGASGDFFGGSVAFSGDTVLIGAFGDDTTAEMDVGSAYVFVRNGTAWSQQAKLAASDGGASGDEFGFSVALSGDTALVGVVADDTAAGVDAGSAYVFVRNGTAWSQQAKLVALDAVPGDELGISVGLSGDTALVGATSAESAYVFVRNGTAWSQQAKLVTTDAVAGDQVGFSVALSGDSALVSAVGDNSGAGSAYIFVRNGAAWSQQAKLVATDAAAGDGFGLSVALSGDTALVGAHGNNNFAGSAYVFVRNGTAWTQQAKLVAFDAAMFDRFGWRVALSADTALVGAPSATWVDGAGSAYVFVRSGGAWSQQAKLVAADAAAGDGFGSSVALSEDSALVGADDDDTAAGANSGSAYVFLRNGTAWSQQAELVALDGSANDGFGWSVALSGDTAMVGAHNDDDAGINSGSAYVFRLLAPGPISVEQPPGVALIDGAASIDFGPRIVGDSVAKTFTIRNSGQSSLASIAINVNGSQPEAFTVDTSGMLTVLPPGGSTTFTVTFTAAGAVTGSRNAALRIASDAAGTQNPFDIGVTGLALSPDSDTDLDGLNDAAELKLAALGFDWQVAQTTLINTLFENANSVGLYTLAQVPALNVGMSYLRPNPTNGIFTLTIGVEKSTTLQPGSFEPFPMTAPQTRINGAGKLEFQFSAPGNASFFRLESR